MHYRKGVKIQNEGCVVAFQRLMEWRLVQAVVL
jgi:hypothetical protein